MIYLTSNMFLLGCFIFVFFNTQIFAGNRGLLQADTVRKTSIKTMRGKKLPTNLTMLDHNNQIVMLDEYFNSGKPVILTMGYFSCNKLCDITINNMVSAIKNQSLKVGRDFFILSININPKEDNTFVKTMRLKYLKLLKIDARNEKSWAFVSADEAVIREISKNIGFEFTYNRGSKNYDHNAVFFVFSPAAILSQTFYGISFDSVELEKSLLDAAHGRLGSYIHQIIINCLHYTIDYGRYKFYIIRLMRGVGLLTIICLTYLFFRMQKGERKI